MSPWMQNLLTLVAFEPAWWREFSHEQQTASSSASKSWSAWASKTTVFSLFKVASNADGTNSGSPGVPPRPPPTKAGRVQLQACGLRTLLHPVLRVGHPQPVLQVVQPEPPPMMFPMRPSC